MTHSQFPPSSIHRRILCRGSFVLENRITASESDYELEGTQAHEVAAWVLKNATSDKKELQGEFNFTVTDEMLEGATLFKNIVMRNLKNAFIYIESRVNITLGALNNFGTPDAYFISDDGVLYIFDYKYGHRYVEVEKNWQMIYYAIGIVQTAIVNKIPISRIELTIIQPRSYGHSPVRTWGLSVDDLRRYATVIANTENQILNNDAPLSPNKLCFTCRARSQCPALQDIVSAFSQESYSPVSLELENDELSRELKFLYAAKEMVETRVNALEEEALNRIQKGRHIPSFRIDNTKTRTVWRQDILDEVKAYGDIFNLDLLKPAELITPAQAIKKGLPEEIANNFIEKVSTKLSLKLVDEQAEKIFKKPIDESVNSG